MKSKHLNGETGKTTLALEKPYWGLMEYLAGEDGYSDWTMASTLQYREATQLIGLSAASTTNN